MRTSVRACSHLFTDKSSPLLSNTMTEAGLRQAKLVLLGDMGAGKSSLVIRFVKGQYFDHLVRAWREGGREGERERK